MRRSVHRNKLILKLVETQLTVLKHLTATLQCIWAEVWVDGNILLL